MTDQGANLLPVKHQIKTSGSWPAPAPTGPTSPFHFGKPATRCSVYHTFPTSRSWNEVREQSLGEITKAWSSLNGGSNPQVFSFCVMVKARPADEVTKQTRGVINACATALKDSTTAWQCAFWDCRLTARTEHRAAPAHSPYISPSPCPIISRDPWLKLSRL